MCRVWSGVLLVTHSFTSIIICIKGKISYGQNASLIGFWYHDDKSQRCFQEVLRGYLSVPISNHFRFLCKWDVLNECRATAVLLDDLGRIHTVWFIDRGRRGCSHHESEILLYCKWEYVGKKSVQQSSCVSIWICIIKN